MENPFFILSAEKPTEGIAGAQSDGTPVQRFTHPAFKFGPAYKSSNGEIKRDRKAGETWLSTFQEMRHRGVTIPVGKKHGERSNPDLSMGEIVHAEIKTIGDGDWLCITNEVRGQKNIETAAANRVSLEIDPPGKVDGLGNVYPERIGAVVYTPIPVVAGQPYALSLEGCEPNTYYLAGDDDMDLAPHFKAIEKMSGLPAGSVNADNMTAHVKAHMEQCAGTKGKYLSIEEIAATETNTKTLTDQVASLSLALEAIKKTAAAPDPKFLDLADRSSDVLIKAATGNGVTKAVADKLRSKFCRAEDKTASSLMLALSAESPTASLDHLEWTLELLKENKPIIRDMQLAITEREVPGAGGGNPEKDEPGILEQTAQKMYGKTA